MNQQQPQALRLADSIDDTTWPPFTLELREAAAELRRLHALNAQLEQDAARYRWMIKNASWYRNGDRPTDKTLMAFAVAPGSDLSCVATRAAAIDAAIAAAKEQT
jgi:hypothetical protein